MNSWYRAGIRGWRAVVQHLPECTIILSKSELFNLRYYMRENSQKFKLSIELLKIVRTPFLYKNIHSIPNPSRAVGS